MAKRLLFLAVLAAFVLGLAGQALAEGEIVMPQPPRPPAGVGEGQQRLVEILQRVLNLLMVVGALVAAVMLAWQGYVVMTAQDGRTRAEAMQGVYKTLLGAALVFGPVILVKVVLGVVLGG
ncbi:MAG: pilin [Bacillota bacterium]